ncbi:hypothetical protein V2J09_006066 [Rumex salicifolius]
MAQAVCEKPQIAIEEEVNRKFGDLKVASAAVNRSAAKASEDLQATGTAKAKNYDLSNDKENGDIAYAKENAVFNNPEKKNRIQVSNTKKPLFFYLNLAKRYIKQYDDVELSALGMAIPTVVTIAEILKANGVAIEKKVLTSTVGSKDESKGRLVQKAKIEIVLEKNNAAQENSEQTDPKNKC